MPRCPDLLAPAFAFASILATAAPAPAAEPQQLLYVTEGNRLRRFDVDRIGDPVPLEDVLIQNATEGEDGPASGVGRDVNGIVCRLPDGSGRFVSGEDTGQPAVRPGWGVFESDGKQVGKLSAPGFTPQPEPFGCAFTSDGRLLTTDVGSSAAFNGQLMLWFPPFDHFPGAPGTYPNGAYSANFCKLDTTIGAATGLAIDEVGRILVASPRQGVVLRYTGELPTSPDAAGGCGRVDAGSPASPLVDAGRLTRATFISGLPTPSGVTRGPNGNWFVSSVLFGIIAEFDANGVLQRRVVEPDVLPPPLPASSGHPQSLAFDAHGTLYYVDLDLQGGLLDPDTGENGTLRRVRFDENGDPLPPEIVREGFAFPDGVVALPGDLEPSEWRSYGGGARRLFFNPAETTITRNNVGRLAPRWSFVADAIVTATPSIAIVDLPGEGPTQVVYVQSWDDHVYALRLGDGSEVWRFETELQPGASYPNTASVEVGALDGRDIVFIGAGEILYALDAVTGRELWRFAAGTGCRDADGNPPGLCGIDGERNEIESSALLVGDRVFFGMDINDNVNGTGGFFALDARSGHLAWFFDLQSGATCRPASGDAITHYDGYHSEAELGLPAGFSATRPGCDFPRRRTGCGNVWSSPAFDETRGLLYVASSNCDTDADPATPEPTLSDPPTMPPYDEAIFALDLDGSPAWRWRPREFDNDDLAFGATPNLFSIEQGGAAVDVLGVGNKDGTYYVVDRDGVNEQSGVRWDDADPSALPYWSTHVVAGGAVGGIIGSAAVDESARRIHFATGPGCVLPCAIQTPTVHALDLDTGEVLWDNLGAPSPTSLSSFSPGSGIPGVFFTGAVPAPILRGFDAASGARLFTGLIEGANVLLSAVASGATVVDGTLVVGSGIGAREGSEGGSDPGDFVSRLPSPVTALCVPGTRGCNACQDGRDDDADGLADFPADPGCDDARDPTETPNARPSADAGADATVECTSGAGATAQLDGSASSDPDGDALAFAWSGPAGSAEGAQASFDLPLGEQVVTLVVDDGAGLTDFATVAVRVADSTAPTLLAALVPVDPPQRSKSKRFDGRKRKGREHAAAKKAEHGRHAHAKHTKAGRGGKHEHDKDKKRKHVKHERDKKRKGRELHRFVVELACSDVCDAAPTLSARVDGRPVADGDVVVTRRAEPSFEATCTDAAGNVARTPAAAAAAQARTAGVPLCGLGFELAPLLLLFRARGSAAPAPCSRRGGRRACAARGA